MEELKKEHWEICLRDNKNMILESQLRILMAERIILLAEEKIAEFPKEEALIDTKP